MEASALPHPVGLGRLAVAGPLLRLRSDDQLLAVFRAGHDDAFGVIHDRYRSRLLAYARQMLGGSRSDAEDVLQDVFLRAYDALRADRRPVSLRAWLYRVAHNRCVDQLRRPDPEAADIFALNRVPVEDPTTAAEQREVLRRLVADVRRLPDQQRSALLMREMEGLSYKELSEALAVTVPAIKSLLVRARSGLVEAAEARDTTCPEIRTDLADAFDQGVRPSGRTRRHLRECSSCEEYRSALRGVEHGLAALSPGGPGLLTTLAKLLGLGGAGSGAAAGGSALGGGVAATGTVGTVGATSAGATLGGGVAAVTAGKVAAVVAAAAVVGGGAATVERVERHATSATQAAPASATSAPTAFAASGSTAGGGRSDTVDRATILRTRAAVSAPGAVTPVLGGALGAHGGARAPADAAPAPAYEPITGGLAAPEGAAPAVAAPDVTAADPAAPAPAADPVAAGPQVGGEGAPAAGPDGVAAPVTAEAAPAPVTTAAPEGHTATTATGAPVAQGAAVPAP